MSIGADALSSASGCSGKDRSSTSALPVLCASERIVIRRVYTLGSPGSGAGRWRPNEPPREPDIRSLSQDVLFLLRLIQLVEVIQIEKRAATEAAETAV